MGSGVGRRSRFDGAVLGGIPDDVTVLSQSVAVWCCPLRPRALNRWPPWLSPANPSWRLPWPHACGRSSLPGLKAASDRSRALGVLARLRHWHPTAGRAVPDMPPPRGGTPSAGGGGTSAGVVPASPGGGGVGVNSPRPRAPRPRSPPPANSLGASPSTSSLAKPFVVLALPGMYLVYKYHQFKRQQQENSRRRLAEKELNQLNQKIVSRGA